VSPHRIIQRDELANAVHVAHYGANPTNTSSSRHVQRAGLGIGGSIGIVGLLNYLGKRNVTVRAIRISRLAVCHIGKARDNATIIR
jgi:hypothetical protein